MRIGILSDSHDNLPAIERIVDRFLAAKVDLVLHAGDFVSPFTSIPLSKLRVPLVGVFGDNDGDRLHLVERFKGIGTLHAGVHTFEVDRVRIALMHEAQAIEALAASRAYDLIVYGHTHEIDVRPGRPAVINLGEAGGWLTGQSTAAVYDSDSRACEVIAV